MLFDQTEISVRSILDLDPKARRDVLRVAGGPSYKELLALVRAERRAGRGKAPPKSKPFKTHLCARARMRGRKAGLEATITAADLVWPSHCPVLGIELYYPERNGMHGGQQVPPNWPSLDRWDNTKGYVPGNVFVISFRANALKSSATYEEILRVAKYLSRRPR